MKSYILRTPIGVFALNEKKEIIDKIILVKDVKKIALLLNEKEVSKEEKELIEKLKKKNYSEFVLDRKIKDYLYEENNEAQKIIRKKIREIAREFFTPVEFNKYLVDVGVELSKIRIKEVVKKDKIVMEVIDAIDEMEKTINIYVARLREWYGLHFPEMEHVVDKHEKFVKLISSFGLRKNIKEFEDVAKNSMGIEMDKNDEEILKEFATLIVKMYKLKEDMEKYLENLLKQFAPNFSAIATPILAARLINLAGGFDKLAKKPSSTIQLLGAEKALFRYLHGHGKSPKHGILFTHQFIQQAPPRKRGKIARVLASKINIAIKMDYYGEGDKSEQLKKELKEKIDKILKEKD
ncbi:MAG: C/D box methylation guide ribonucleoprotein complex aNOP56 subunit [Candidatus Aenigmarchaeota archaeon]|nr:C/D box methylation guide ribonucleoprotein complex aNOP56 subunit [Candidatus Aenigmarchaeota archaeon]